MKFTQTKIPTIQEKKAVLSLWNNEYPAQLHYESLEQLEDYLYTLVDLCHVFIKDEDDEVKAWYFDFLRDENRWFVLIIHSDLQHKGFGTQLINAAKLRRTELNGWIIDNDTSKKSNGDPYKSPEEFYRKNHFKIMGDHKMINKHFTAIRIAWNLID